MFEKIRDILTDLLDVDAAKVSPDSYLVRDLAMESIDFLELAVALNQQFNVEVHDDTVFLRNLRLDLAQAEEQGIDPLDGLKRSYGFLSDRRLQEIIADLDAGPAIRVRDLERYIQWQMRQSRAA